jgi:4-amino-4-deoxy-L-arabinose transferase-like glycosyltransferase
MTSLPSRSLRMIVAIAAVALVIRVTAGLVVGWNRLLPVADQPLYHAFAKNIAAGKGFQIPDIIRITPKGVLLDVDFEKTGYFGVVMPDRPTAFFPPVYPVMMAAAYKIFGPHYGSARLFQSLFDALACFLIGWMGIRLFGRHLGVLASLIYAAYPAFIGLTTVLWTIGMGVFTLVLALALTIHYQQKPSIMTALWMGMAWGLATLSRSAILPFLLVVIFLGWWDANRHWQATADNGKSAIGSTFKLGKLWKYPAMIAIGILILLLPWGIRNLVVMGHFTLTPTKAGRNLYEANNGIFSEPYIKYSATAGGMAKIYHRYALSRLENLNRKDLIEFPQFPVNMDEFQRDNILKRQVRDFLTANPKVAVELCVLRLYSLIRIVPGWGFHWLANAAGIVSMGFVLAFGVLGLIFNWKRRVQLSYFYLLVPYYIAVHTLTAAGIPHRLPLDALLIVFAASVFFWRPRIAPEPAPT